MAIKMKLEACDNNPDLGQKIYNGKLTLTAEGTL